MAYRGKVLVAVVGVFIWLVAEQQVTFVNGDKQLIESTCAEASKLFPCDGCELSLILACGDCLTYTPGSANMDLKRLGRASIDCESLESVKAVDLAREIADDSDQFDAFLPPFGTCIPNLDDWDTQISHAIQSLEGGRYADAIAQVQSGDRNATECSDELKKYQGTQDLVTQIAKLQLLSHAAVGVLRQIH